MSSSQLENLVSRPGETTGPLMSISCWCLVGISFSFLIVRLAIRQSQRKIWLDDAVLSLAWVLLLIQVILNQLAINLGYGKHALDVDLSHFNVMIYYGASELTVSITAITLSKISFGITLLRLTDGWLRYYVWFGIATLAIFATPVAVIPWVQCKPLAKTFLDLIPGTCIDKHPSVVYGRFQAVWSAIIDFSFALLPWKVLWNLQMRTPEKIGVGIAMSLGLLAGVTAILRAKYIEQLAVQDVSYDSYNSIIWAAAETAMCVVATSIPVLRVFFKQAINSATDRYNSSGRSKSRNTNPSKHVCSNCGAGGSASTQKSANVRQSSKKTLDSNLTESFSGESMKSVIGKREKNYVELDDLLIDEETGRVTNATPESFPAVPEQRHEPNWHV